MPSEIHVVLHNKLSYDYHFIIKELANEYEGQCLGKNTEEKLELINKFQNSNDKNSNESVSTISYKIKFIDSARFMATTLSNLTNNLAQKEFTKLNVNILLFLNTKASRII